MVHVHRRRMCSQLGGQQTGQCERGRCEDLDLVVGGEFVRPVSDVVGLCVGMVSVGRGQLSSFGLVQQPAGLSDKCEKYRPDLAAMLVEPVLAGVVLAGAAAGFAPRWPF